MLDVPLGKAQAAGQAGGGFEKLAGHYPAFAVKPDNDAFFVAIVGQPGSVVDHRGGKVFGLVQKRKAEFIFYLQIVHKFVVLLQHLQGRLLEQLRVHFALQLSQSPLVLDQQGQQHGKGKMCDVACGVGHCFVGEIHVG